MNLERLREIYKPIKAPAADVWGRRTATPGEISRALKNEVSYDDYPPTEADIKDKNDR